MMNETINSSMFTIGNITNDKAFSILNVNGNMKVTSDIVARWVWSYDFYLLLGLIGCLIIWNIWITYKLNKLGAVLE